MATKTQKKSNKTLKGTKGNDNLTVSAKKNVEVFAYAGNDKITVTKGAKHKIYAGAGKDTITVAKNAKTGINVYGDASEYDYYTNGYTTKGDKDTITVNGGKSIGVFGEAGNDVITVNKGKNLYICGGAGTDTIKVYDGSGHTIYGDYSNSYMTGQKADNIYIYGGAFDKIYGGGGADKIIVSQKAKGGASEDDTATIYGGAGGDTITVSVGTNYNISGDAGADIITLKNSKTYSQVTGGDGNDNITVNNSNNTRIDGGADNDTITVTGGTDNSIFAQKGNNTINATSLKSSGGYFSSANIACGSGKDTITLTKCSGYTVDPGEGANEITIDGGQNNTISYSSTDSKPDTIEIKGGSGHVVTNSLGGKVTVSGSGTTCDITVWAGNGSATLQAGSKTALSFNYYNSGKFTVNAAKGTLVNDMITFKSNSSSQFTFDHDGSALTLTGNGAGSLTINNFTGGAFSGGIQFSNGLMSYADVKTKAGL
jgi:hypothetical protein